MREDRQPKSQLCKRVRAEKESVVEDKPLDISPRACELAYQSFCLRRYLFEIVLNEICLSTALNTRPRCGWRVRTHQLEVKRRLVENRFHRKDGCRAQVAMGTIEQASGGMPRPDMVECVNETDVVLVPTGALVGGYHEHSCINVVAERPLGVYCLLDVEGLSLKQKEPAVHPMLGQLMLFMGEGKQIFIITVSDQPTWERQLVKISKRHEAASTLMTCRVAGSGTDALISTLQMTSSGVSVNEAETQTGFRV